METNDLDLVWTATGIRRALGLDSNDQVYRLIRNGELNGIVGYVGEGKHKRLYASRRALRERFTPGADKADRGA